MAIDQRCINCFQKTYDRLMNKYPLSPAQEFVFAEFFENQMNLSDKLSSPEIQRNLFHKLRELNGINDLFSEEKRNSNKIAALLYDKWKNKVLQAEDPFMLALRLSIAGNIMDYGANINFDVEKTIQKVLNADFAIDHSEILREKLSKAKNILYLGDNAGEIVFDRLFVETINKPIVFAVKSSAIINDVTFEDARVSGIDKYAEIITNGYDAPSTVLPKCSEEFLKYYHNADVIISKGQGNFEGLIEEKDSKLFFLLMVKCDVIAEHIHAPEKSFIVYNPSV